jgi:tetratricopeptide (TPR) repeat protein
VSYARALYLSGRRGEATAQLHKALQETPDELLANFLTGVIHQEQGESEQAAGYYAKTLQIDPGHPGALYYLANLHFNAGRYAQAASGYAKSHAAQREIAPARLLELVARLHAGEPETEIFKRLSELSSAHPQDPMLSYALARSLAAAADPTQRRPEQALKIASRLALLQPIPPHQSLLALAQAASDRFGEAIKTQEQALAMAPWMMPPQEKAQMQAELAAYRQGRLPQPAWPENDPLLSPPPFDPVAPFRDYPASVPY